MSTQRSDRQAHTLGEHGDELECVETEVQTGQLEQELRETKERLLKTTAELENYRKRTQRDFEEQRRFGALSLVQDLLAVADNLRRAVESAEQSDDFEGLHRGVQMVLTQFDQVLVNHGLNEIKGVGEPFDPYVHEATNHLPSEKHPAGYITEVVQVGFRLHDRVVRPAKVVVSSGPPVV